MLRVTDDPSPSRLAVERDQPIASAASATSPVLVGVDGSPSSLRALDLAADEAGLRGRPLRVVYAYRSDGAWAGPARPAPPLAADPGALLARVRERLRECHPTLDFTYHAAEGDPMTVLIEESAGACLTVVGHRGIGGYVGLAAGSVSEQLLTRGHGPVIVARGAAAAAGAPVVVGVDPTGSGAGRGLVEFALAEAALRKVRVEALYAWMPFATSPVDDQTAEARQAAEALCETLGQALRSHPDVELKSIVEPATNPAAVLVAATRGAGLMVVGAHVGSPLRYLQPGSVGAALLREAYCPVAVVHRQAGR